jgi:hypothetical protein
VGLPTELRRVLNLQNQDELRLSNEVKLATIEARSREEAKCTSKGYAATTSDDYEEPHIDAFQQGPSYNKQGSKRFQQPRRGALQQRQQPRTQWRSNTQGNNSNCNGQTCIFCKMQNHHHEDCHKRIKANKPCLDSNGHPFWPKVNAAEANPTNSVQAIDFSFQDFQ